MIQMRRDVIEQARMPGTRGFVLPGAGRTGDMDVNTMAQGHRVTQNATRAMSRFPLLGMPAVFYADPGA